MLLIATAPPARKRDGNTQHAAQCVNGSYHRQQDQQDEHRQPIRPAVVDVPPDDREQQHAEQQHNVAPIAVVGDRGPAYRPAPVSGVHQVIDLRIDRPLQLGSSLGGFWWESIEQLHVLHDQPSIVRASELPGRNGQHCAAKTGALFSAICPRPVTSTPSSTQRRLVEDR